MDHRNNPSSNYILDYDSQLDIVRCNHMCLDMGLNKFDLHMIYLVDNPN
jgi:hypothetical protein